MPPPQSFSHSEGHTGEAEERLMLQKESLFAHKAVHGPAGLCQPLDKCCLLAVTFVSYGTYSLGACETGSPSVLCS